MKVCPICDFEFGDEHVRCPRHDVELVENGDPYIGTQIGQRYLVTETIGRGSMGVVYKAKQIDTNKEVAIKILHAHLTSNRESIKRFHHEAKAASRLRHPNIVHLYDVGVIPGGQPYIAMELLTGMTLADFLQKRKYLDTSEALPIIRMVCEALAEAHSHGVVHRDIKPANIMLVNKFGQENFVVVLDFSISKVIERVSDVDSTTPGLIFGSPAYMSPERFLGKGGDFRSDIYSLGIIMFQMLSGKTPFRANDLYSLMHEHVTTSPPRVKEMRPECDIPDELEVIIGTALAKKAENRQENVREVLSQLNFLYRPSLPHVDENLQLAIEHSAVNVSTAMASTTVPVFKIDSAKETPGETPVMSFLNFSDQKRTREEVPSKSPPEINVSGNFQARNQQGTVPRSQNVDQHQHATTRPNAPVPTRSEDAAPNPESLPRQPEVSASSASEQQSSSQAQAAARVQSSQNSSANPRNTLDKPLPKRPPTLSSGEMPVLPAGVKQRAETSRPASQTPNEPLRAAGSTSLQNRQRLPSNVISGNKEEGGFPLEAILLTGVLFIAIFIGLQMSKPAPIAGRIEEYISSGHIDNAARELHVWKAQVVRDSQKELFDQLCMEAGYAYFRQQKFRPAADCFSMVSDNGSYSAEARNKTKLCRKKM
jgi:serine/threonine protein kinase